MWQILYCSVCYLFGSGNWAANILVTEHLQYPVHFCFPLSQQKTELLLIFNQLRFSFSSLHLLASCILFHCFSHTFYILVYHLLFLPVLPRTSELYNRLYEYPQNPGKLRDTSGASLVCLYADGTISFRSYHFTLVKNSFSKEHRAISWNMGVYFVRTLYPSVISGYIRGMLLERDSDVILFLRAAGIYGISLLSTHICFRTEKLEPAGRHRFIGSGLFHHLVRLPRTVIDSRICSSIGNHLGIRDNQRGNGGYRYFPVDQEYPDQEPRFILRKVSYGYID